MSHILVISSHPDDETLGCGGTLLKHKAQGDTISWLIMTNMKSDAGYSAQDILRRQEEIEAAARAYAFDKVYKLDFPAARLDTIPMHNLVSTIDGMIKTIRPEIVYVPNRSDAHSDHRVTFDAVYAALKIFRAQSVRRIFMYETLSETEFSVPLLMHAFVPTSFSDISEYIEKKIEIMKIYKGELGAHPFPRSEENIRALATFRGAMAGARCAEAFMIVRDLW